MNFGGDPYWSGGALAADRTRIHSTRRGRRVSRERYSSGHKGHDCLWGGGVDEATALSNFARRPAGPGALRIACALVSISTWMMEHAPWASNERAGSSRPKI